MADSIKNIFAIPELRNRVLFTLGLLGVYRFGHHIPTPGVNAEALAILAEQAQNTMFGLYDMFSGGNLSRVTIFCAWHHALYQCLDHFAALNCCLALP